MKNIATLLLLFIAAIGYSQNAPIDFEAGGNGAAWTWTVFENSTNPPLAVIANPDPTGANTSATVAEFTALQAGMPFAGVESLHGADIGTFTLDATNAIVKIMVWKPVISNVGVKFATNPGGSTGEMLVPNTLINQWEELTFDFSSVIGNPQTIDIDQIVIFPDFDARTQDNIVYFDNITFNPVTSGGGLPLDFEGAPPTFNDFNGSFTQVIANPDPTGVNTSANVAENTVPANAAFAGVNIVVPVDITTDKFFRMDVWSPVAGMPVLLKLEGGPNAPIERQANLTTTGAWEEIVFDFSSEGALTYDSVTVFMNFNMVDPNTQTYYWDNLELYTPGPPPVALPLDFEGAPPTFNDFNGSFTQVITNPDPTGVNTSANVAENTVPANAAFAGVNIVVPVDITTDKFFRMDVWSPVAGTPVLLKLEGGPNAPIERQATLTTTGAWEEIVFDFSSEGALTYDSVTVFMNFNMVDPNTQTYYWDNLELYTPGPPPVALPLDFEGAPPAFNDFNGSFTQVIANPDPTGVNTSANVAENTVPANAAFAGVNIVVPVDITTDKFFRMDVWSPVAGTPVLLKLEGGPNAPIERQATLTTTGAWEEIVFDFSSEGALTYDSVTIFMNFNMVDPNTQIYYWDNLELYNPGPPPVALPLDFEGAPPAFNDFNGSFTQVIANPDPTGVNTSANVAENTVPANAAFAGVNIVVPVDITTDKFFRMDVWSPVAGMPVLLKLEGGPNAPIERQANLTTTGAWEEIVFDFSSEGALTYDSVTVFMNFNMVDPNTQTYYWDNLELYTPGTPLGALPLDFESTPPPFNDFNGSITTVSLNPDQSAPNTSVFVARNTVPANASFAGVNIPLVTVDITTDKGFIMDVWSPGVNTPVLLKLENSVTGVNVEREVSLTTSAAWEELFFDFSTEGALTFDSATVFMNFNMVDPNEQVYYWDNLEQFEIASGDPVVLPVDFENTNANYDILGFEGADSAVEANPDQSGINTSATVVRTIKTVGAQFFAGTILSLDGPIDFTASEMIAIKTWSPKADIPVRVKLENADGSQFVELDVNTTVENEWEELVWDFTGMTAGIDFTKVVVFFEFVVDLPGDGSTYYYDDIEVFEPAGDPVVLPVDFENTNANYDIVGFEGADSAVEANPDQSGINTSATVVRTIKTVGAQFFAGTILSLDGPIDFTASEMIAIKTWSPKADIPVRVKLENADGSQFLELDVNTTVENEWEELVWDFTGMTAGIDFTKVVVFFEFVVDLPGDGSTYYYDDIQVVEPLGVGENELNTITSYPNPVVTTWNVQAQDDISAIVVYNLLGQQVLTAFPNKASYTLDLTGLRAGIYLVNVATIGRNETIKIIKK